MLVKLAQGGLSHTTRLLQYSAIKIVHKKGVATRLGSHIRNSLIKTRNDCKLRDTSHKKFNFQSKMLEFPDKKTAYNEVYLYIRITMTVDVSVVTITLTVHGPIIWVCYSGNFVGTNIKITRFELY